MSDDFTPIPQAELDAIREIDRAWSASSNWPGGKDYGITLANEAIHLLDAYEALLAEWEELIIEVTTLHKFNTERIQEEIEEDAHQPEIYP